jgi:nitrogen fixation/metabolism regulation signal transduction histidine kinase
MARTTLGRRLTLSFSIAILIPSLTIAFVGGFMLRRQVVAQAQERVTSDLEAGKEIYQGHLERLKDALRIHARPAGGAARPAHAGGPSGARALPRPEPRAGGRRLDLLPARGEGGA